MAVIIIEGLNINITICDQEGILDFGNQFSNILKNEGFKNDEILKIKLWFKGCLAYKDYLGGHEPSCYEEKDEDLLFDVRLWTIYLEYSDDINMSHDDYNTHDKEEHKNILINNMFLHPRFNHSIKFVFASYSLDKINGIPDEKSEKSFCSSDTCLQYSEDLPFKRAYNPYSKGYDCGD